MTNNSTVRRAKIVCTIGPSTRDPYTLRRLIAAGMDVVRVNFSHTSHEDARRLIGMIREAAAELGKPVAILADLQGPKIRVGDLPGTVEIQAGKRYSIVPEGDVEPEATSGKVLPTTYEGLADDVGEGDTILIDDGRIEFRVSGVSGSAVEVVAENDGPITSQKGINLPGITVRAPGMTEKDRRDLELANEEGVDYVALSFVRRAADLEELRTLIRPGTLIIAKIVKEQAVQQLRDIMRMADGVMVARGDLGVEMPFEEVPIVQKRILRLGQETARLTITATQMLESMVSSPRPTRAEASDVANALLDGTDAVMLSAETAVGAYPVEAVETMDRIIRRIERETHFAKDTIDYAPLPVRPAEQKTTSAAVAAAAFEAIQRLECPFVVTFTASGSTARVVAAQRPAVPILAVTDQRRTYTQLPLVWGVVPILHEGEVSFDDLLQTAREYALKEGLGRPGQRFVVTAGVPFHEPGTTNIMRVEEL